MKIKTKLLLAVGGTLLLLLTLSFDVILILTSNAITKKLDNQLNTQVENITSQVSDLITTSARSFLTATGLESNKMLNSYYDLYTSGELTYERSFDLAVETITSFEFLDSGTVFVTDDKGIILAHPDESRINTIAPMQAWIQRLQPTEKSFKSYEYQNKNKLVYRVYNKQFNINICVDSNTSEFLESVDLEELNKTLNNIRIGRTGYPFLLTQNGLLLTDPDKNKRNSNIVDLTDEAGNFIYKRVLEEQNGKFEYEYKDINQKLDKKFLVYNSEKNSELIICLTGSVSEFYDTLSIIKKSIYGLGVIALLILIVVLVIISSTVTIPIKQFIKGLNDIVHGNGDLTKRIHLKSSDEIGEMGKLFNSFLDTIQNIIIQIKKSTLTTLRIKDKMTYGINETSVTTKKILANITSIKNQTKQLEAKVELSVNATNHINNNITALDESVLMQSDITKTTNNEISHMISDFNDIEKLVALSRDNTLRITSMLKDKESVAYVSEILTSLELINTKTDILHGKGLVILKYINNLDNISKLVKDRSLSIKKESDEVAFTMSATKQITSFVVDSMGLIINASKKISSSMDNLGQTSMELEDTSDLLQSSVNMFKTKEY